MTGDVTTLNDANVAASFTSRKLDWIDALSIDPSVTSHDFEVGVIIAQHMNVKTCRAILSDESISFQTRTRRRHIIGSRQRLRDAGWLSWDQTKTANVYRLHFDSVDRMLDLRTQFRDEKRERRDRGRGGRVVHLNAHLRSRGVHHSA